VWLKGATRVNNGYDKSQRRCQPSTDNNKKKLISQQARCGKKPATLLLATGF
jgi:hypothetical protein